MSICAGQGIYYSQDGGATWAQSSPNAPSGANMYIYGIASSASGKTMVAAVYSGEYCISNVYVAHYL